MTRLDTIDCVTGAVRQIANGRAIVVAEYRTGIIGHMHVEWRVGVYTNNSSRLIEVRDRDPDAAIARLRERVAVELGNGGQHVAAE